MGHYAGNGANMIAVLFRAANLTSGIDKDASHTVFLQGLLCYPGRDAHRA